MAAVVIVYAVLAFAVLGADVIYSGDTGIKFIEAQSVADSHGRSLAMPYRGAFLDPRRQFSPFRAPFVRETAAGPEAIFPPASAVLQAPFVAIAGLPGLRLLSVIAGGLAIWAAWRLLERRDPWFPLVLGLGTPIWFYAVTAWEHAPATALASIAFLIAWRGGGWGAAIVAGLLLGAGGTIRDEAVLLVPGLLFGVWWRTRRWTPVAAAAAGAVLALAAAGVLEVWWFQRPLATHSRHAVHLLRRALQLTGAPNPELPTLAPMTLRERYQVVIQYWLLGYGDNVAIVAGALFVAAAAAVRLLFKSSVLLVAVVVACAVLAWWDAALLLHAPKWVAGLFRLAPFLVFALFPRATAERAGWLMPVALVTLGSFLLLAVMATDTTGGKALGPRLMLPLVPLLAASAWTTMRGYLRSVRIDERVLGVAGLALAAAAVAIQVGSTIPAYAARSADDQRAIEAVLASPQRIIVADDMYTAQELMPLYYRRLILLADSPAAGAALGHVLSAQRMSGALVVSRGAHTDVALPPYTRASSTPVGRFTLDVWRR